MVVQPGFADRANCGLGCQGAQQIIGLAAVVAGMVWMQPGGRIQNAGMSQGECQRILRALGAGPSDHQLCDAGRVRALQHRVDVGAEAFVGQVGADVDKLHGGVRLESAR